MCFFCFDKQELLQHWKRPHAHFVKLLVFLHLFNNLFVFSEVLSNCHASCFEWQRAVLRPISLLRKLFSKRNLQRRPCQNANDENRGHGHGKSMKSDNLESNQYFWTGVASGIHTSITLSENLFWCLRITIHTVWCCPKLPHCSMAESAYVFSTCHTTKKKKHIAYTSAICTEPFCDI